MKVFISSSYEDLKVYREKARDAVIKAEGSPIMMEYFAAGGNPPLPTCLEKVKPCDVLVVIVAHRYGWIPAGQSKPKQKKSITWLECEQAIADGKDVLAFLIKEDIPWLEEHKENYRLTKAMSEGNATPELFQEVNAAVQKFKEFKTWLKKDRVIVTFTNPDDLASAILHALNEWQKKQGQTTTKTTATTTSKSLTIPEEYRQWLLQRCAKIDLQAALTKTGTTLPRLSSVYVPVPTIPWIREHEKEDWFGVKLFFLLDRLTDESLFVPGLAGSGKSTFCRWVGFLLCEGAMPDQRQFNQEKPILEKFPAALKDKLPLLIPLRELWPFLPHHPGQREMSRKELEKGLTDWLLAKIDPLDWPTLDYFLNEGRTVLLFDGVDEVPVSICEGKNTYYPREMLVSGLKESVRVWKKAGNRLLLTSRPYGLADQDAQEMGLPRAEITDLPDTLQWLFMTRWFTALEHGQTMADEMRAHLEEREELSQLRGNPVMLMAMCVLFPEGKRLPQDKAELYEKTIERMLYNRYVDKSEEVDKVYNRLSVVAYGMHTGEGLGIKRRTPQAQTNAEEIDRLLQSYLGQTDIKEKDFTTVASVREDLLSRSGLLVQKDNRAVSFYHLSFQEYLAGQRFLKLCADKLVDSFEQYAGTPEWRPTLAFTFGTILQKDRDPDRNMKILRPLLEQASVTKLAQLVLCADFIEILYRKNYVLETELLQRFKNLCLEAIEKEVPVNERYEIGRALGLVGDQRIVVDLRTFPEGFVKVPAGIYLLGEEKQKKRIEQPFWITKYPVTNSQYRIFLEDGGYNERNWWSPEGWQWRKENKIIEPEYWRYGRWNGENLPVVGVSWYEADAFCRWAGGMLPPEQAWEAAVRGPQGNVYAWGNQWENGVCNNRDAGLHTTSPVGIFPRNRSKDFELEDMTGNIWEWCQDTTFHEQGELRGGSFYDFKDFMICSEHDCDDRYYRSVLVGFRVFRVFES